MTVEPPRPKGPPLNALRAFEAAARLESFSRAGRELNVSASAVAQQVKLLEAWLGRPLFDREAHGVRLNGAGRAALPRLIYAFDALGDAVRALNRSSAPSLFRIAALPSVAQLWLSPRLPSLRRRFPDLAISVTAMERPPNLIREPIDLALFFGDAAPEGVSATALAAAARFPICAPQIAERLNAPTDLARETLLHDATWREDWPAWLRAAGVACVDAAAGPVFSLYSLALEAAKQGAGVLIGNGPLVADAVRSGALVRPFAAETTHGGALTARYRSAEGETAAARLAALTEEA